MSKIIAFSGGCLSGKTTAMEYIKNNVPNVKIISELIRELWDGSIDELRSDPNKYLDCQLQIITTRYTKHMEAFEDKSDTIYLEDRSLADTFFYLLTYVDTKKLDYEHLILWYGLIQMCQDLCSNQHYDKVLIFEPLTGVKNEDKMRPEGVEDTNKWEYQSIRILDYKFYKDVCEDVNVQKQTYDEIISKII